MTKQELDARIEKLNKKQTNKILALLDSTGGDAYKEAIAGGKTEDEAKIIAEAAALKAGEEFLKSLEKPEDAKTDTPDETEKEKPAPVSKKLSWGGYTTLQTEPFAKSILEELKKIFVEDTEITVMNFAGSSTLDKAKGKLYKITAKGNKIGIKSFLV